MPGCRGGGRGGGGATFTFGIDIGPDDVPEDLEACIGDLLVEPCGPWCGLASYTCDDSGDVMREGSIMGGDGVLATS